MTPASEPPGISPERRRYLLIEMAVVLAVGVVPALYSAIRWAVWSQGRYPIRMRAFSPGLLIESLAIAAPVLFIMWRSGEGWNAFGMRRPRGKDLLWGAALYAAGL